MTKVYIEIAVPIIIFLILILWSVWSRLSLWRARKKYNPDDDLGKKAEESRRRELERESPTSNRGGDRIIEKTTDDARRPPTITEQELFQTTTPVKSGEVVDSGGKNRKSPGRFLGKFRRKRG